MRIEKDFLGERILSDNVYYGIHTLRASENFALNYRKVHPELIKAIAFVKKACIATNMELGYLSKKIAKPLLEATDQIIQGKYLEEFILDGLQGGAGTSINMNVNEVITNIALEKCGKKKGEYETIHPIEHTNMHQSTNDVFPTAVKVCCMFLLRELEKEIYYLQSTLQEKEKEFAGIIKMGRTQLQDAVPMTLGAEFAAYAEAIARDRWRVFKCEERLRVVNIGGTAIGTGLTTPRRYIFLVIEKLRQFTGLPLSRAEFLVDPTQNQDSFVEVSGILKAHAVNLFKIANDLRLLSSGPVAGFKELRLPPVQAGSSIMPHKINPVIPEMVQQVAIKVIGNDYIITEVAKDGNLELNQFLPLLADSIIESLKILKNTDKIFAERCIKDIKPNIEVMKKHVQESPEVITAFIPYIGYEKATEIVAKAYKMQKSVIDIIIEDSLIESEKVQEILSSENLSSLGYREKKNE